MPRNYCIFECILYFFQITRKIIRGTSQASAEPSWITMKKLKKRTFPRQKKKQKMRVEVHGGVWGHKKEYTDAALDMAQNFRRQWSKYGNISAHLIIWCSPKHIATDVYQKLVTLKGPCVEIREPVGLFSKFKGVARTNWRFEGWTRKVVHASTDIDKTWKIGLPKIYANVHRLVKILEMSDESSESHPQNMRLAIKNSEHSGSLRHNIPALFDAAYFVSYNLLPRNILDQILRHVIKNQQSLQKLLLEYTKKDSELYNSVLHSHACPRGAVYGIDETVIMIAVSVSVNCFNGTLIQTPISRKLRGAVMKGKLDQLYRPSIYTEVSENLSEFDFMKWFAQRACQMFQFEDQVVSRTSSVLKRLSSLGFSTLNINPDIVSKLKTIIIEQKRQQKKTTQKKRKRDQYQDGRWLYRLKLPQRLRNALMGEVKDICQIYLGNHKIRDTGVIVVPRHSDIQYPHRDHNNGPNQELCLAISTTYRPIRTLIVPSSHFDCKDIINYRDPSETKMKRLSRCVPVNAPAFVYDTACIHAGNRNILQNEDDTRIFITIASKSFPDIE